MSGTADHVIGGRYQILELLGEGGMGTVYKGTDLQTESFVAIKKLKPEAVVADPDILERFAREGEALRKLNHPNIVKMLAALEDAGQQYLIMEYMPGGDLSTLLERGQLGIKPVLEIALDLADALTRAHRLNIIHRDLKPVNVLLAEDGTPRLTDFGVARMGSEMPVTQTGTAVGTLGYLSPEALNGATVDARTDIWAFGVMLFEMLVGKHPFEEANIGSTLTAILTKPTPDLEALRPDCPLPLVDLVYRMLEKDRHARIPSVRLVGAELEALLQARDSDTRVAHEYFAVTGQRTIFETPTPASDKLRHNLPAQTTPFVGREEELAELAKLLDDPLVRLVTILAPGGMGKTRLALESAQMGLDHREVRTSFTNGVFFVALAPLTSPEFIVPTVGEAVGFQFSPGGEPKQQLLDFFREKHLLLVMDNFEHVLASADIISEILQAAPDVKIVATSRVKLNLSGENDFYVSGMEFPDWETPEDALEYSAVKLFLQSARRVRPGFELKPDDLRYIARICRMVAGMPLGILLAAAWVEMLSLNEIAEEIGKSLDFLESEMRDAPERHRSMRAVFDYSWNLLADDERAVFAKLAIFRGGFTREAAQAVAGASLRMLAALVNKSLLRRDPDSGRYEVHELLRQYAEERLNTVAADAEHIRDLHSAYYAEFLSQQYAPLLGRDQNKVLAVIESDIENIRSAWTWAVAHGKADDVTKSLNPLLLLYEVLGRQGEGAEMFNHAADTLSKRGVTEDDLLLSCIRLTYALMAGELGDFARSKEVGEKCLAILRQHNATREIVLALNVLSYSAMMQGRYPEAKGYSHQAMTIVDGITDVWFLGMTVGNLGYVAYLAGDYEEARQVYEDGLRREVLTGNSYLMAILRNNLGEILHDLLENEAAKALFEESYALYKDLGNRRGMAYSLTNLGNAAHRILQYEEAQRCYEEALAIHRDLGDKRGTAQTLNMLGGALFSLGDYPKAKAYHEEALQLFREMGDVRGISNSLAMLVPVSSAVGEYAQAQAFAEECLQLRRDGGNVMEIIDALGHAARAEIRLGDYEAALGYNEQIQELMQQGGGSNPTLFGRYMGNKAFIHLRMGNFKTAKELYEQLIPHVEASGFKLVIVIVYSGLGAAETGLGHWRQAAAALRRSLQVSVEARGIPWMLEAIVHLGYVRGKAGSVVSAVEILTFARESHFAMFEEKKAAEKYLGELKALLPSDECAAAIERGKTLELDAVVQELLSGPAAP
jgi:predicted ATPase/Tfp pilus assembly protein PilF